MTRRSLAILVIVSLASNVVCAVDAPAQASNAKIEFLSKDAAAAAIVADEIEPYISLLTPLDMATKVGGPIDGESLDAKRDAFRKRYSEAALDFTDEERIVLRRVIERVQPTLDEHYPLAARTPWSLIKKATWLEGGAHFTRERHIVLSEQFLRQTVARSKQDRTDQVLIGAAALLLHEQTHVLQRLHPKLFADLYADLWNMKHVDRIEENDWLHARQLVNPDAVDVNWIATLTDESTGDERIVWPRIILTKTEWPVAMFRDAAMVVFELEKANDGYRVKLGADGVPIYTPLGKDAAFTKRFPHGNAYHPNEAAAALWSAIVLGDAFPGRTARSEAAQAVEAKARTWLRERMKAPQPPSK